MEFLDVASMKVENNKNIRIVYWCIEVILDIRIRDKETLISLLMLVLNEWLVIMVLWNKAVRYEVVINI